MVLSRLGDDVAFGAENLAVPRCGHLAAGAREALDDVGLGRLPLDHPTSALSGGQKQRLALAGILAMRPGLLLLDEPTANLDPAGVLEVRDAVGRCLDKTGATLVVVEHRVAVWKDLVDRIVVLQPGSATDSAVLIDGPPDRVLAQARDMLIAAGVWVPGYVPQTRAAGAAEPAPGPPAPAAPDARGSCCWPRRTSPCPANGRGGPGCARLPPRAGPGPVRHHGPGPRRRGADHHRPQRLGEVHLRADPRRSAAPGRRQRSVRATPLDSVSRDGAGHRSLPVEGPAADRQDRNRVPGTRAPVRHRQGPRRAHVRPAPPRLRRRPRGRTAGAAAADGACGRQPLHALRRREAAAFGGHRAGGAPPGAGPGRAHLRPGCQYLGRTRLLPLRTPRRRHRRRVRDARRRIQRRPRRHRAAPPARAPAAADARRNPDLRCRRRRRREGRTDPARQPCAADPGQPARQVHGGHADHPGAGAVHRLGVGVGGAGLRTAAPAAGRPDCGVAVAARLAADPGGGAGRLEHRHPGAGHRKQSCSTPGSGPSAPVPCSWGSASCSAGSRSHCPRCC